MTENIEKNVIQCFKVELLQFILYKYIYSTCQKSPIFCFAQLLMQILVNFQNQGQIWNPLVLAFSKHPLDVQFDQVLGEILEIKDT